MYGIDIDGVVANFSHGFSLLLYTLDGKDRLPIVEDNDCRSWDWNEWYAQDEISRSELKMLIERAWEEHIKIRGNVLWSTLSPLFPDAMETLNKHAGKHPVMFITRRDGPGAWQETVSWLHRYGVDYPLVYVCKAGEEKSDICHRMRIDTIIDDSPKYAQELLDNDIQVIMPRWRYNKSFRTTNFTNEKLLPVGNLEDALRTADILERGD